MEDIISGISAFNFYRNPPSSLATLSEPECFINPVMKRRISQDETIKALFGLPLHCLVFDQNKRANSINIKHHLWTGSLPSGALRTIDNLGTITSPEMTLFMIARDYSLGAAAMAMYEMCGGYAVYDIPQLVWDLRGEEKNEFVFLDDHTAGPRYSMVDYSEGWEQVFDFKNKSTGLWMRPPLTSIEDLKAFAADARGCRGVAQFERALSLVKGCVLSPFEARAAIMLGTSRRLGGFGFDVEVDAEIPYDRRAQRISGRGNARADILITSPDGNKQVDVECQGAVVHTGDKAGVDDARRTAAVESMGISVVPITFNQLASEARFSSIVELIYQKLGMKMKPKTETMMKAEQTLRYEIFTEWD